MMKILSNNLTFIIILLMIFILLFLIRDYINMSSNKLKELNDYIQIFHQKEHRLFPFRYFTDINNNVLPRYCNMLFKFKRMK
jgi:hypothetical protein